MKKASPKHGSVAATYWDLNRFKMIGGGGGMGGVYKCSAALKTHLLGNISEKI